MGAMFCQWSVPVAIIWLRNSYKIIRLWLQRDNNCIRGHSSIKWNNNVLEHTALLFVGDISSTRTRHCEVSCATSGLWSQQKPAIGSLSVYAFCTHHIVLRISTYSVVDYRPPIHKQCRCCRGGDKYQPSCNEARASYCRDDCFLRIFLVANARECIWSTFCCEWRPRRVERFWCQTAVYDQWYRPRSEIGEIVLRVIHISIFLLLIFFLCCLQYSHCQR